MNKPTIGRIVIYNTTQDERKAMETSSNICNAQEKLPATIVSVHSETCVNLKVSLDGNEKDLWKTSATQGDGPGQWNWPVIAK